MKTFTTLLKLTLLLASMSLSLHAQAFYLFGTNWTEEVLLHDGTKLMVERSQTRGGNHEIGQEPPIKDQMISFKLPGSGKKVIWEDHFAEDVGSVNFVLILLDILNDTPYLAVSPPGCIEYNKWGRPNPPYIFFKYDGTTWKQIPVDVFPKEFKSQSNMITAPLGRYLDVALEANRKYGYVPANMIVELNKGHPITGKSVIRTASPELDRKDCPHDIPDGHNGWIGIGFFTIGHSYEKCIRACVINNMSAPYCPCDRLFKENKDQ